MKSIGILGSRGFLGGYLTKFFAKQSRTIKILSFEGDTRNEKQIERFVKKIDLVIHLATKNRSHPEQEIFQTNINGSLNVINACYSHGKGFLTCVERNLTIDAFSVSKNVLKSFVSEYNKLGFQGFLMKLDPIINSNNFFQFKDLKETQLLEILSPEDVCRWIYSFSDAFLTNGSFYVKEFEFWDPIRVSVKEYFDLLYARPVKNVSAEHAQKILKCFEKEDNV